MNTTPEDNRTNAQVAASIKANLIRNGMPQELVNSAVDSWLSLIERTDALRMIMEAGNGTPKTPAWWAQYCFMQGFCAGNMCAVHHN